MATSNQITQYYLAQAGGGFNQFYAGSAYQRGYGQKGYGLGSWLGGLFRSVLPLLKSGALTVGREAARAGSHVLADVAVGDNFKESLSKHGKAAVGNLKRKAEGAMQGSGAIKRRRPPPKPHSVSTARQRKTAPPNVVDVVF
jgi:hypothetical protein